MNYSDILKKFKENNINDIDAEIVSCVNASLSKPVNDEEFNLLCSFTKSVWDKAEKGYTQLIADIVVDLYQDCEYGYRDENSTTDVWAYSEEPHFVPVTRILTLDDLKEQNHLKRDMVIDIFCNRY